MQHQGAHNFTTKRNYRYRFPNIIIIGREKNTRKELFITSPEVNVN